MPSNFPQPLCLPLSSSNWAFCYPDSKPGNLMKSWPHGVTQTASPEWAGPFLSEHLEGFVSSSSPWLAEPLYPYQDVIPETCFCSKLEQPVPKQYLLVYSTSHLGRAWNQLCPDGIKAAKLHSFLAPHFLLNPQMDLVKFARAALGRGR